jgi:CheY-like chemotaxis protein
MNKETLPRILCVDDEPRVVDSLAVQLRREYQVLTANDGQTALRIIKEGGAPAVVVSDMRMPGMDGATLLRHIRLQYPDTTRILLTGETGRATAVAAVNEGQIFRFLTKPCSTDNLRAAIDAGVTQHRVVTAERVLLQETLIGCIKALVDVLAITNPVAFGHASRVKRLATDVAKAVGIVGLWQLEAAAMLSQIGYISLPVELVEKLYYGKRLTPEERVLASAAPQVAQKLLGHIPRLEPVLTILDAIRRPDLDIAEGPIKQGAAILSMVTEYDVGVVQGQSVPVAIQALRSRAGRYDVKLINALESLVGEVDAPREISEVTIGNLEPSMVLMDDLYTQAGSLLVPKGFEVTETFLERTRNFSQSILEQRVRVVSQVKPGLEK